MTWHSSQCAHQRHLLCLFCKCLSSYKLSSQSPPFSLRMTSIKLDFNHDERCTHTNEGTGHSQMPQNKAKDPSNLNQAIFPSETSSSADSLAVYAQKWFPVGAVSCRAPCRCIICSSATRGSTTGCCGTAPLKTSAEVMFGPYSFFIAASFTDAFTPADRMLPLQREFLCIFLRICRALFWNSLLPMSRTGRLLSLTPHGTSIYSALTTS